MPAEYALLKISGDGTTAIAAWKQQLDTLRANSAAGTISGLTADWGDYSAVSPSGYDVFDMSLAISADGTRAVLAWVRFNGSNAQVYGSVGTITGNTVTWSSPAQLSSASGSNHAKFPQVAISADGLQSIVVWQYGWLGIVVQGALAHVDDEEVTWSSGATINNSSGLGDSVPKVTISADGTTAAIIYEFAGEYVKTSIALRRRHQGMGAVDVPAQ